MIKYTLEELFNNRHLIIQFKNKSESIELSESLDKMGKRWCTGASYINENEYPNLYNITDGRYGEIDFYTPDYGYIVIPYSEIRHLFS